MPQQSFLSQEDPLDALYKHFNVYTFTSTFPIGKPPPAFLDVQVRRDAHMPTHLLALYPSDASSGSHRPLLVPIDASLYNRGFRSDIIPLPPPGTTIPVPYYNPSAQRTQVTLPVIPVLVPHPPSIPLLLLYGMGLETHQQFLTLRLLPSQVVEEFPNAAEMAEVFAKRVRDYTQAEQGDDDTLFQRRVDFNKGMWQNILSLGMRDVSVGEVVKTAWNVTAEAKRLRTMYKKIGIQMC